jgi:arylsulfatase A-like enzyme
MRSLLLIAVSLTALISTHFACASDSQKPNIIVILSDDMGFSDLGCYGSEIKTPNLDALAENGLRFTQFYNTPRCCTTRASLLTGLYSQQAGIGHLMENTKLPGYQGNLTKNCRTIAEVLRPAGYRSYMAGKWHLTRHLTGNEPKFNWPLQRGFDRFYGTIHAAGSFYDPATLTRDNKAISPYDDNDYQPKTYYYTDAITDHALLYLRDHFRDHSSKPFFMYVAYTAGHWPMHALPDDIAKYKGKYKEGYEAIRKARFEKAAKLGLIDAKQGMSPLLDDWDKVPDKKWEAANMEVYAAMVDRMDQGIGKILDELKKAKELDNTLILYLQDNGASAELIGRTEAEFHPNIARPEKPVYRPIKPEMFINPSEVPVYARDGYPIRMGDKVIPGPEDTYVAYGRGWATVSNTPFRDYKRVTYEGGINTPFIAHWPKGISMKGEIRKQPGHVIDLMATCVEISGAKYPDKVDGEAITPMEGKSLLPAFANKPIEREALYWEHQGNRAIRVGDWKLVARYPWGKWELYDLSSDRIESTNLAQKNPDKVDSLAEKWEAWAKRTYVLPWPWDIEYKREGSEPPKIKKK